MYCPCGSWYVSLAAGNGRYAIGYRCTCGRVWLCTAYLVSRFIQSASIAEPYQNPFLATVILAAFGVAFLPFPCFTLAWSLKRRCWQLTWLLVVALVFGGTYGSLGTGPRQKTASLEHLEWTWDAVTWISIVGMLMAGWLAVALRASQSLIRRMWRWEFRSLWSADDKLVPEDALSMLAKLMQFFDCECHDSQHPRNKGDDRGSDDRDSVEQRLSLTIYLFNRTEGVFACSLVRIAVKAIEVESPAKVPWWRYDPGQNASLGCGTLIIIAIIVAAFSGREPMKFVNCGKLFNRWKRKSINPTIVPSYHTRKLPSTQVRYVRVTPCQQFLRRATAIVVC